MVPSVVKQFNVRINEVATATVEGLRKHKVAASKILNCVAEHTAADIDAAHRLEKAIADREAVLEDAHLEECKSRPSMQWHTCDRCRRSKPVDDSYFGIGFRDGVIKPTCKACLREETKSRHSANPEQGRERAARLGKSRQDDPAFVERTIVRRRELQGNTCAYCGAPLGGDGQLDHVLSKDRGGTDDARNLVLACRTCNTVKARKTVDEFLEYRRRHKLPIREGGFYQP